MVFCVSPKVCELNSAVSCGWRWCRMADMEGWGLKGHHILWLRYCVGMYLAHQRITTKGLQHQTPRGHTSDCLEKNLLMMRGQWLLCIAIQARYRDLQPRRAFPRLVNRPPCPTLGYKYFWHSVGRHESIPKNVRRGRSRCGWSLLVIIYH